jgi:mono/diheme cytochrome c family protein
MIHRLKVTVSVTAIVVAAAFTVSLGRAGGNSFSRAVIQTPALAMHSARQSALDLEVGGDLIGLPADSIRYITRKELLALPQHVYTVSDDPNFTKPAKVSGVLLAEIVARVAAHPDSDMAVAICSDKYRANYPRGYLAAQQPLLVLQINGQPPAAWPKDAETRTMGMGPYMISHPKFSPGPGTAGGGPDESQIPWGVVRIDLRDERQVFASIEPRGPRAGDAAVQTGYNFARQNCFRCHNSSQEGGEKSGVPWMVLATLASAAPDHFASYVRNPRAQDSQAQMPGNPGLSDETLRDLTAYFQTFAPAAKP